MREYGSDWRNNYLGTIVLCYRSRFDSLGYYWFYSENRDALCYRGDDYVPYITALVSFNLYRSDGLDPGGLFAKHQKPFR